MGQGLLEAFSETCDCCKGRGVIIHTEPILETSAAGFSSSGRGPTTGNGNTDGSSDSREKNKDSKEKNKRSKRRRGREEPSAEAALESPPDEPTEDPVPAAPAAVATVAAPALPAIAVRANADDPDALPADPVDGTHNEEGVEVEGARRRSRRGAPRRRGK
jgi:ribonuclease E